MELSEKIRFIIKVAAIVCLISIAFWILGKLISLLYGTESEVINIHTRGNYINFCYVIMALIAPFGMYKNINHPKKGVEYASLPISLIEKYISMMLNSIIIAPAVVVISLLFFDFIKVFIDSGSFNETLIVSGYFSTIRSPMDMFFSTLGFQSLFIFGNAFFIKNKIVKTFLSVALLYVSIGIILLFASYYFKINTYTFGNEATINFNIENLTEFKIFKWTIFAFQLCFLVGTYFIMKIQQYK